MDEIPVNEVGKSSSLAFNAKTPHEQIPQEGSLRSLLRKSSDFTKDAQRIYSRIDSHPKNRRYVPLKLSEIYTALVDLYATAFGCQWPHFKRTGDAISASGTQASTVQKLMAQIYISHWIIDLYVCVKECVDDLSQVAYIEAYIDDIAGYSNEYDSYLVALNQAIRPTHILGCHEDVMFIPRFPDDSDFTNTDNPFGITDFAINYNSFKAIMCAIKDKRAGWKIDQLSTDKVGRPSWLFDWFSPSLACAWFPIIGNFISLDVAIAYILGVACTPKLAQSDDDAWQPLPTGMALDNIDLTRIRRVTPRKTSADYEVDHFSINEEKFTLYLEDSDYDGGATSAPKRPRHSRDERDTTAPGYRASTSEPDEMSVEITTQVICLRTYLYYSRVILDSDPRERMNSLLGFIIDSAQHCTR
jgi:hypothetical protein